MSTDHRIRQANLGDLETIVRHRRMMFADIGHGDPELLKTAEPVYTEWLRERLENGRYQGWLMMAADGTVVAGVGLWLIDWPSGVLDLARFRGYVFNVYTDRSHRRQGFSYRLMQVLLDACVAQGINVVGLHASAEGRPVYTALGFKETNEMRIVLEPHRKESGADPR